MARVRKSKDVQGKNESKKFICQNDGCGRTFTRAEHLQRHLLNHSNGEYTCDRCRAHFKRRDLLGKNTIPPCICLNNLFRQVQLSRFTCFFCKCGQEWCICCTVYFSFSCSVSDAIALHRRSFDRILRAQLHHVSGSERCPPLVCVPCTLAAGSSVHSQICISSCHE